jgi:hypothetical protein
MLVQYGIRQTYFLVGAVYAAELNLDIADKNAYIVRFGYIHTDYIRAHLILVKQLRKSHQPVERVGVIYL